MHLNAKFTILLLFLVLLANYNSWSQSSLNFGVNISTGSKGFPTNGKFGVGGSIEFLRMITKHGGIRFYAGYDYFHQRFPNVDSRAVQDSIKIIGVNGYDFSLIPLRIGYQHFLFHDAVFIYADAGLSHIITQYKNPSLTKNLFSYGVGAGYQYSLKKYQYLKFSVFYNHNNSKQFSNRNYITFRAAYALSLQKNKK